jgi:hypothetical protein
MAFNRDNFLARYRDLRSSEGPDSAVQDSEQVDGPLIDMRDGRGVTITYTLDQLFNDPNFTPPRNSLVTGPARLPYDWEGEIFDEPESEPKPSPAKGLDEQSISVLKRALAAEAVVLNIDDTKEPEVTELPISDKPSRKTIASILTFRDRRAKKATTKRADAEEAARKREEVVTWLAPYAESAKAEAQKPKYSFKVRVQKKLGDAQMWMTDQLSFNGNHSKRNKVALGVGVAAVGYMAYKGIESNLGGHETAVSLPVTPPKNLNVYTPGQNSGSGGGQIASEAANQAANQVPAPIPEVTSLPVETVTINAPGQGIWQALEAKGYNDNQILDMVYGLAEKQGVPVESLNYVEIGQTFEVPLG